MKSWKSSLRDWLGLKVTKEDVEAAVACIDVFNESQPGIEYSNPGYIVSTQHRVEHTDICYYSIYLKKLLVSFMYVYQLSIFIF
jgi:hypothetical protein